MRCGEDVFGVTVRESGGGRSGGGRERGEGGERACVMMMMMMMMIVEFGSVGGNEGGLDADYGRSCCS